MDDTLPFDGFDLWTAFELSWLNQKGKPLVGMAEFKVPAKSKNLIESKSLKLYLNSLNQSHFDSSKSLQSVLSKDLSNAAVGAVSVTVFEGMKNDDLHIHQPEGVNIDDIDIEVHDYRFNEGYLKDATQETAPFVSETLM